MDLRQLTVFLAVIEAGSLGDAAKKLHMSQPALTKSIQALERSVGMSLFTRSRRGMALNALGRSLEIRARVIASELMRAKNELNEFRTEQKGRVVVGTGPGFAQSILPKAVVSFWQKFPRVEIVFIEDFAASAFEKLKIGELDYAFFTIPDAIDDDLESEALLREVALFVTAPNNPLASKRRITLQEIWPGPWVLGRPSDIFRKKLTETYTKIGMPAPDVAVEYGSTTMAKAIAREKHFIAFLSEEVVRAEFEAGLLKTLRVADFAWERKIGVIYRKGTPFTPAAQRFLDEIRTVCKSEGGAKYAAKSHEASRRRGGR